MRKQGTDHGFMLSIRYEHEDKQGLTLQGRGKGGQGKVRKRGLSPISLSPISYHHSTVAGLFHSFKMSKPPSVD